LNLSASKSVSEYRVFCKSCSHVPLFSSPEWLDVVCGEIGWGVISISENGKIVCAIVYRTRRILGVDVVTQPSLTQNVGPWFPEEIVSTLVESRSNALMELLAKSMPNAAWLRIGLSPSVDNWLPFYWQGYKQTTRYTYRISKHLDRDVLVKSIAGRTRRDIKFAEEKMELSIDTNGSVSELYEIISRSFSARKKKNRYSYSLLENIQVTLSKTKRCEILLARDRSGVAHGGIMLVGDCNTVYYLAGASDPYLKNRGVVSFLLRHAMIITQESGRTFDFEGSMIRPIEFFVRSFGGVRTPYHVIYKSASSIISGCMTMVGRI